MKCHSCKSASETGAAWKTGEGLEAAAESSVVSRRSRRIVGDGAIVAREGCVFSLYNPLNVWEVPSRYLRQVPSASVVSRCVKTSVGDRSESKSGVDISKNTAAFRTRFY